MHENEPIKVVIVDDHQLVIDELCSAVNWERLGLRVVGTAKNGRTGWELCCRINPDIAIVDIEMPVMDGLALTEKLKESFPHVRVLLLTSYDRFQYAVEAIKAKADDYILKGAAGQHEIVASLRKQKEKILEQRRKEKETEIIRLEMNEMRETAKQKFVRDWVEGIITDEPAIREGIRKFNLKLTSGIAVCVFRAITGSLDRSTMEMCAGRFDAAGLTQELCPLHDKNGWVILVPWPIKSEYRYFTTIRECALQSLSMIRTRTGAAASAGISARRTEFYRIPQLVSECLDALGWMYYEEPFRVYIFGVKWFSDTIPQSVRDFAQRLLDEKDWMLERPASVLAELADSIVRFAPKPDVVREFWVDFVGELLHLIPEAADMLYECRRKVGKAETLKETVQAVADSLERYREHVVSLNVSRKKPVEWVKQWISRHLDQPISLEEVARRLNMSPKYLGNLFRKEMNETFIAYVNRVRLEKAIHLLVHTNKKITDIAREVGIYDPSYFSRLFKSKTGKSPNQFRDDHHS